MNAPKPPPISRILILFVGKLFLLNISFSSNKKYLIIEINLLSIK